MIITTSINNKVGVQNDIHRQNRYIECINHLLQIIDECRDRNKQWCGSVAVDSSGHTILSKIHHNDMDIIPIIVENNGERKTFLDNLKCEVCYTNNNIIDCPHKGGNELLDIKEVINRYNIKDDDIIIKLTGRYNLLNSNFINMVKNANNNYDAFVKFFNVSTREYVFNDCVLGLFAVKCKYLKKFEYNFFRSPECEFAEYIRNYINEQKLKEVEQLYLECCFAGDLSILHV